jgi:hypothetical protein
MMLPDWLFPNALLRKSAVMMSGFAGISLAQIDEGALSEITTVI